MSDTICKRCGEAVTDGHRFCMNCGSPVGTADEGPEATPSPDERPTFKLVLIRGEGGQSASYSLGGQEHLAGRDEGIILFPDDNSVSARHATFFYRDDRLYVKDEGSANGTYVRVTAPVQLKDQDRFVAGEQVLLFQEGHTFEPEPDEDGTFFFGTPISSYYFKLTQALNGGKPGAVHCARKSRVLLGREKADFSFPDDRFMSHKHAAVEFKDGATWLSDVGSRNGTFIRLRFEEERLLNDGDYLFIGKQLIKVSV